MYLNNIKNESSFSERFLYRNFIYKKVNENNPLHSLKFSRTIDWEKVNKFFMRF